MKCMVLSKPGEPDTMESAAQNKQAASVRVTKAARPAVSHSRKFFDNRFVYAVISQRARGLSIGVNMNPDKFCNFDCAYCEVNRDIPPGDRTVELAVLAAELESLLLLACRAKLRELPYFRTVPEELMVLKE